MKSPLPTLLFLSSTSIFHLSFSHINYVKVCNSSLTYFFLIPSFFLSPQDSMIKIFLYVLNLFRILFRLSFLNLKLATTPPPPTPTPQDNTHSAELSLGRSLYFHNLLNSGGAGVFFAPISCLQTILPNFLFPYDLIFSSLHSCY